MKKLLKPASFIALFSIPQIASVLICAYSIYLLPENYLLYFSTLFHIAICLYSVMKPDTTDQKSMQILLAIAVFTFSATAGVLYFCDRNYDISNIDIAYLVVNAFALLYMSIIISVRSTDISIKKQSLICVAIPVFVWAVSYGLIFSGSSFMYKFEEIMFVLAIIFVCAFIFLILRLFITFAIINKGKHKDMTLKYRIFIGITAILLPIAGLMLNADMGFQKNLFGDFTNIWFYIIAALNGVIMMLEPKSKSTAIAFLFLKGLGVLYIAYFTVIFIPLMPLGIIGIIFFGLGLLIYVPVTVLTTEIKQIIRDIKRLNDNKIAVTALVLGILTLPSVICTNFYIDRLNFDNALMYVSGAVGNQPEINIKRIEKAVNYNGNTRINMSNFDLFGNGENIPVISRLYGGIVLDNKIISPDTNERLSLMFLNTKKPKPNTPQSTDVKLSGVYTETEYDEKSGAYKTWVHMTAKNNSGNAFMEYRTNFNLPDGCVIKDYYLYVNGNKKFGILSDKRAALTVYESIITTPRDPGIIYYEGDNLISLRVYPFSGSEERKTGFLVMHSQNEVLKIDGTDIELKAEKPIAEPITLDNFHFIPERYKESLQSASRTPKYYFMIDSGKYSPVLAQVEKANNYIAKNQIENYEIYSVSYRAHPYTGVVNEGGFNLAHGINMAYSTVKENEFPIIIAVSNDAGLQTTVMPEGNNQFPESRYFYNLDASMLLTPYSFENNRQMEEWVEKPIITDVLLYNNISVPKTGTTVIGVTESEIVNEYLDALILQEKSKEYNSDKEQIKLIKESFEKRVLTKYTAFTVLETEQQEEDLKKLQEKLLSGKTVDNTPEVMMSEPGILLLLPLFLLLFIMKRRKTV